jgi:bifunctional DNase/RNase
MRCSLVSSKVKLPMREMKIIGLALDQKNESSVVVLKEVAGETALPIAIGLLESTAIASGLENIAFPRPMTHDLLKTLMDELGVSVRKVEISDLRDETFYARIYLKIHNSEEVNLDARPSDALAIALRTHSRIYVHERVLEKSSKIHTAEQTGTGSDQENEVRTVLKSFSLDDFREYW